MGAQLVVPVFSCCSSPYDCRNVELASDVEVYMSACILDLHGKGAGRLRQGPLALAVAVAGDRGLRRREAPSRAFGMLL